MLIETVLKNAVKDALSNTISEELRDIAAKETRRVLREREEQLIQLVRAAVREAIEEMMK